MNRWNRVLAAGLAVTGSWSWVVSAHGETVRRPVHSRAGQATARDAQQIPEMVIPGGPHYLTTGAGASRVPVYMPADFFFEGSEPTRLMVDLVGVPLGDKPARVDGFSWDFVRPGQADDDDHRLFGRRVDIDIERRRSAPYDTVMVQYQDAVLPAIGSQVTVDLKLMNVRLRSTQAIEVGGDETRFYDLVLEITPYDQERGRAERMGTMTLTRDGIATGYFTSAVYGWARFIFTPTSGGESIIYDLGEHLTIANSEPTPFFISALQPATEGHIAALAESKPIAYCCNMESMCVWDPGCGGLCCAMHCP